MALKTVVESLDEVPEALHEEYQEREDGKFVLQIEGVDSHPTVVNLKTAHEKTKSKNRELSGELGQVKARLERLEGIPEEFDTEAYEDLVARAEANGGGDETEVTERLERQKATLEAKHQRELEAERKRIEKSDAKSAKLEGQLRRVMIDEGLTKAMLDAGVEKQHIAPLRSYLKDKGKVRLVESDEEDGGYDVYADDGVDEHTPLSKFVGDWASSDEGSIYVAKATGSDAKGGNGQRFADNPWDDKGGRVRPNLTKQQEIIAANPEKARQMARAAGATPNW